MEACVEQGFATKTRLLFDKTDKFWENFEKFQEKNYKKKFKQLILGKFCKNTRKKITKEN